MTNSETYLQAITDTPIPGTVSKKQLTHQMVLTLVWAIGLFSTCGVLTASIWGLTVTAIFLVNQRIGHKKNVTNTQQEHLSKGELILISVWSTAPALVLFSGTPASLPMAIVMLASAFLVVLGRYRDAKKPAIIVATPYVGITLWLLSTVWGQSYFFYYAIGATLLFGTFVSTISYSIQSQKTIKRYNSERDTLIEKLKAAKKLAEDADEFKTRFLANMSHEIRTPLNGIVGLSDALLREVRHPRDKKRLKIIYDEGQTLKILIDDILDLSKIQANGLELAVEDIDMVNFFDKIKRSWADRIKNEGLIFETHIDPNVPPRIMLDPTRVKQCIDNLIGNSLKFTKEGRIEFSVKHKVKDGRSYLKFSVEDSGCGISESRLNAIFEPFVQAETSTAKIHGGTGLGLTITKSLSQLMGGGIVVKSRIGQGTEFVMAIEVFPSAITNIVPTTPPTPLPQSNSLTGLNILVAEDNEMNIYVLRTLLEPLGVNITHASNGKIAVELAGKKQFDMVFMDIQMPEIDGVNATKLIRAQYPNYAQVPIIAVTANVLPQEQDRYKAAGMNNVCVKPHTLDDINRIISQHWKHSAPHIAA